MKVICKGGWGWGWNLVDTWEMSYRGAPSDYLTLGNMYDVLRRYKLMYVIICDDGIERLVSVDLFESVEVYRDGAYR